MSWLTNRYPTLADVTCPNDCDDEGLVWIGNDEGACSDPEHCDQKKTCPACDGLGVVSVSRLKQWESKKA